MRVGFVYSEMETLGVEHLSSYLKEQGHQTTLFFDPQLFNDTVSRSNAFSRIFGYQKRLIRQIIEWKPEILAFSVLSTNYLWAKNLAQQIKCVMDIPIVWGGIHPTLSPESVIELDFVDFVVVGEGEQVLLELVENLGSEKRLQTTANLWSKKDEIIFRNAVRPLIDDLDSLPFPDKGMFYSTMPYLSRHYTIVTSRGCPHMCTFCCNHTLSNLSGGKEKFLRRRSAENVIAELKQAQERYKIEDVFFDDSTFTYDKNWLKLFSQLYKKHINLRCFCWVYPAEVDEETVRYLIDMNIQAVEMGVESLNPHVRKKWLRRPHSNKKIQNALALFKKNRIFVTVDNIVGLPEETINDLEHMADFYNRTRPEKIYIFELRPFPNTDMFTLYSEYKKNYSADNKELLPFTLSSTSNKAYKQITALVCLIHLLPVKAVKMLLAKKWYRKLPAIDMYNLLEIVPFFINFLKPAKHKRWFPIRGTRHRYFFFGSKIVREFLLSISSDKLLKKIRSFFLLIKGEKKYSVIQNKPSGNVTGVDK
ncbi:MAG: B12-binding domain-containing radical SAM protein [Candidatus Omnitrophica bacterium]|nr:B12-binding domain-containing radical SAM protein [Candidatus Omnitrophota bacterium]